MSPIPATPSADPAVTDAAALDTARATIRGLMARHRVPGVTVAVTDAERLLFAEGFGYADLADRRPATTDTGYLWFSMSKIATATAAMRLAEQGRLDLDAPVSELVPEFVARAGDPPRLRQLLEIRRASGRGR